jgi:uncharacterized protein
LQPIAPFICLIITAWLGLAPAYAQPANTIDLYFNGQATPINAELAITQTQREQGLMFRRQLAANKGMLFVFPASQAIAVWMKNTLIALDIVFLNEDGQIIDIAADVPPCRETPCPIYRSIGKARYMLEISAGLARQYDLKVGQKINLPPLRLESEMMN